MLESGNNFKKKIAPRMQTVPPIKMVSGTPMKPARLPARKVPKGAIPIKETT